MHMLRADSPAFTGFGEVYFSLVNRGAVKAWKRHTRVTQRLTVPVGAIRFVVYDDRPASPTRGTLEEHILSVEEGHRLLVVPSGLWYGFQGLSPEAALVANCPDLPHDPAESETLAWDSAAIPFHWPSVL